MNLREIDRLVAEKVMGYSRITPNGNVSKVGYYEFKDGRYKYVRRINSFQPTWSIKDAWQVVEKMKRSNFSARHRFVTELQKEVTPKELKDKNQLLDLGWMIFYLTPKSICLAALKAAGVNIE